MCLRRTESDHGSWKNEEGVVFKDPSLVTVRFQFSGFVRQINLNSIEIAMLFADSHLVENGPSYALIESQQLDEWLTSEGLAILWLIGGEKQLFSYDSSKFYGRLTFSGMCRLVGGAPEGGPFWCRRIEPRDNDGLGP